MASDKLIIKYATKNDRKEEIFHSSGVAAARRGAGLGAASTESFSQRQQREGRREFIKGYGDSKIMRGNVYQGVRAKTYTPGASTGVLGESAQNLRHSQGAARTNYADSGTGAAGANGAVSTNRANGPQPMRQAPPMRRGF